MPGRKRPGIYVLPYLKIWLQSKLSAQSTNDPTPCAIFSQSMDGGGSALSGIPDDLVVFFLETERPRFVRIRLNVVVEDDEC